jgi:hypothetical protein
MVIRSDKKRSNAKTRQDFVEREHQDSPKQLAKVIEAYLHDTTGHAVHVAGFQLDLATPNGRVGVEWRGEINGARYTRQDTN